MILGTLRRVMAGTLAAVGLAEAPISVKQNRFEKDFTTPDHWKDGPRPTLHGRERMKRTRGRAVLQKASRRMNRGTVKRKKVA